MLRFFIVALGIGSVISAGAVEAVLWTQPRADREVTPAAFASVPSIAELHAKTRTQDLPDLTVKEPY